MKPTRPSEVAALLAHLDFRPRRALGQNFLVDANILEILLRTAEVGPQDQVLEIGPGLGILTGPLLARAARVVAIEKDDRLYDYLAGAFAEEPRLELVHADALAADLDGWLRAGVNKLVANLPYATASRMLVDLAGSAHRPQRMVVTVQDEVGQRLAAAPGSRALGVLSLLVQYRYDVRLVKTVSERCFFPPPRIRSVIVRLDAHGRPGAAAETRFRALVKCAFSRRRGQLGGLLAAMPDARLDREAARALLRRVGLDPAARPETLAVADWIRLADALEPGAAAGG